MLPECMTTNFPEQPVEPRPWVVERLRRDRLRVHPVRDHPDAIGRSALLLQPAAHGVADRDDAVGALQVEPDQLAQRRHEHAVVEPPELCCDLGEDVLGDDEQRHAEPPRDGEAHVAHHRRIGHAEDEVGPRPGQPLEQRAADVRGVVERAQAEIGALEGGRRHAHDLHAVAHLTPRKLLVAAQHARQHADLVLVGERLAELGEQVRRRLDARPVVLVDDEQTWLRGVAHGAERYRPPACRVLPYGSSSPRRRGGRPSRSAARSR